MYKIEYHKKVLKDIQKLKQNKLDKKARQLIELLKENPFQNPPPYERLIGDLKECYSMATKGDVLNWLKIFNQLRTSPLVAIE